MEKVKKIGRPTRITTHKIESITISKIAMNTLDLTIFEAIVLDVIYQYQRHEKVIKGFCLEEKKQIAQDIQLTDVSVHGYLNRLEKKGLIFRTHNMLQVTEKYLLALVPASNIQE